MRNRPVRLAPAIVLGVVDVLLVVGCTLAAVAYVLFFALPGRASLKLCGAPRPRARGRR
ncbi:hypothetical protein [Nonomuraea sp. NPDC049758]|uniref:hypothetical protein n=1 Tax=Nonomuraea sp. NPDC049758 TaxID=3154360 RepID=UPI00341E7848